MTIPVTSIVDVSITIGTAFPARKGFGVLNCVTAELGVLGPADRIRFYSDAAGVSADWGSTAEATKVANTYFGQNPRPTDFAVSWRSEVATAAQLIGGKLANTQANIDILKLITDGTYRLGVTGFDDSDCAVDLSTITTMADVATIIQTSIQALTGAPFGSATCVYDAGEERFVVEPGDTGSSSTITFFDVVVTPSPCPVPGTDLGIVLILGPGTGAFKSDGADGETITEALDAIEARNAAWYGFLFTQEMRESVSIGGSPGVDDAASWAQARVKVFFAMTNDLDTLDLGSTTDIAFLLNAANYDRTLTTFSSLIDQYPDASIAGRAFTVDFAQPNSTITLKFKQGPGITVEDFNTNEKTVLDGKRANAFFTVGNFDMYGESFMGGRFFFDQVHGVDWLTDAIQTEVFGYLATRPNKVAFTDKGVAAIENQVIRILDEGVRNGLIAPGVSQEGVELPLGYSTTTIPVASIAQAEKDQRQYNGLSFLALGADAIHGIQISAIFES